MSGLTAASRSAWSSKNAAPSSRSGCSSTPGDGIGTAGSKPPSVSPESTGSKTDGSNWVRAVPVAARASGVTSSPIGPWPLIDGAAAMAAAISSAVVPSSCHCLMAACISGKTTANGVASKTPLSPKYSGGSSRNSARTRSGRRWLT